MTVEERMHAMDKKLMRDKKIEEEKAQLEAKERNALEERVKELYPRIKDIIRLGVYCKSHNIKYPNGKYLKNTTKDSFFNDFESDGIRHYFGFVGKDGSRSHNAELHVGWINSGFCGPWDVHCDGDRLWLQHEKDENLQKPIDSPETLGQFIKDFEVFEKNFYEWFDETCSN